MTREEAQQRAAALSRERPGQRWVARQAAGGWEVTGVTLPPGIRLDPLKATVEARPEPRDAPDPRPAFFRDVGGPWAGGG